jgi:hypothetical protein
MLVGERVVLSFVLPEANRATVVPATLGKSAVATARAGVRPILWPAFHAVTDRHFEVRWAGRDSIDPKLVITFVCHAYRLPARARL